MYKSNKLHRDERIEYLKSTLNVMNNLRFSHFDKDNNRTTQNIKFNSALEKPLYSWWKIFWDIIIGLNIRK